MLKVEGLTRKGVFNDITFSLRAGEIVGLAGLVGAGRSEVARAIFGVDTYESGTVTLHGATLPKGDPKKATARGIALVPEDRRKQGLVLDDGVSRNITLAIRSKLSKWGLIWDGLENEAAQVWASRLEVKTAALDAETGTLSGGNQQKVVIGKWLATEPNVLIVDEPTRGIDVGTKSEVHRLLSELAQQGLAILMISSELPEVLGMADRVLVMREGRLTGEFRATPRLPKPSCSPRQRMRRPPHEHHRHAPASPERAPRRSSSQHRHRPRDGHRDRAPPRDRRRDRQRTRTSSSPPTASATSC